MGLQNFVSRRLPAISAAWLNLVDNLVVGTGTLAPNAQTAIESANSIVPTNYAFPPGDVRRYGGTPDGATDSSTAFIRAATVSAAGGGDVVISGGTFRISSDITFARGATVRFIQGGIVTVDSGKTLKISGSIFAPRTQIFSGSGISRITGSGGAAFGAPGAWETYPEWWGAVSDGSTDSTNGINLACLYSGGGRIMFSAGVYLTDGITASSAAGLVGAGKEETFIRSNTAGFSVTAATSANPIAITLSSAHKLATGDIVTFASMPGDFGTNLNGTLRAVTVTGTNSFTIAVNGGAYAAYTSGGTVRRSALIQLINTTGIQDASAFTVRGMTVDGNSASGNIGLQVNNYSRFSVQDCTFTGFASRAIYYHGAILAQVLRTQMKNTPLGFEADTDQSTPNSLTLRDCSINGCATYGVKITSGALFVMDGCDVESCGTAGNAATGGVWLNTMDTNGLGVAAIITNTWMELNNGYAGIRIDAPAAAYSEHIVQSTHIFGGTRTYGLSAVSGANFTYLSVRDCVFSNAGTTDLNIGANVIGTIDSARATTRANASTNMLILHDALTGNFQFSGGKLNPPTDALAPQTGAVYQGSGVPNNANGANGDYYFRTDTPGTANQRIYVRAAGAWSGIL